MSTDQTTNWLRELVAAQNLAEDESETVALAPNQAAFLVEFDSGFGLSRGPEVLAWTEDRVYFPVTYDGMEMLGSAPRNPQDEGQAHVGGE